jgi:hypothetical protein
MTMTMMMILIWILSIMMMKRMTMATSDALPVGESGAADNQPDLSATDPYKILAVSKTATQVEIRRAYFAHIRQYPPETEPEKFKIIRGAYEKIKNATRRAETDVFLMQPPPDWQPLETEQELITTFQPEDVAILLNHWGDLANTDVRSDFSEISL